MSREPTLRMDWVTRVPLTRAEFYGPERSHRMGNISRLHVTRASVHSDQVVAGRVTLALGRRDGDPYGIEVDFTPWACRQLSALLLAAAGHADAGGEPKDFKLDPDDVGD